MRFQYQAIDAQGKRVVGSVEAASELEAKEKLRTQKILITALFAKSKSKQARFARDTLATVTTQLAQLLSANMPLYECLITLEEQCRGESYHPILQNLAEKIQSGLSLSDALSHHPKNFDRLYIGMVTAGEATGHLDIALQRLANLQSARAKLKKKLTTALLYPAFLLSFSLVMITLLLTFVVPSIEMLFEGQSIGGMTRFVIGVSHFLTKMPWFYLPILAFLGGALFYAKRRYQSWIEKKMLRLSLVISVAMARFTRTMGALQDGGVALVDALQIARKVVGNRHLERELGQIEEQMVAGNMMSAELKKSPWIPSLVWRMVAIGEESGTTGEMMNKLAAIYEEEVEKTLTRVTALAGPVILLGMGLLVGILMMAVLLPLTDVNAFL